MLSGTKTQTRHNRRRTRRLRRLFSRSARICWGRLYGGPPVRNDRHIHVQGHLAFRKLSGETSLVFTRIPIMRTIKDMDPERFAAEAACRSALHQNFKNHLRRSQTNDAVRRRPIEIDPRWPYARAIVVNANKTVQRQLLIGFAAFRHFPRYGIALRKSRHCHVQANEANCSHRHSKPFAHSMLHAHTGKLSCLRPGISTVLPRSMASARAMRGRVACGMMTSSI